jgi:C4-dicarboxylate-binding protein DctP
VSNHGYLGYAVIVNKKFWDGLPSDIRSALENAMKEATRYGNAIAQQENEQALDAVRKSGKSVVYVLNERELDEWRQALLPIQNQIARSIGPELLAAINKEAQQLGYR